MPLERSRTPALRLLAGACGDPATTPIRGDHPWTGAIEKRASDGVVLIDPQKCNGCGRCIAACPYGAVQRTPGREKVGKCDFSAARWSRGLAPVCIETRAGGALHFGPLDEREKLALGRTLHRRIAGFPDPDWTRLAIRFLIDEPKEGDR